MNACLVGRDRIWWQSNQANKTKWHWCVGVCCAASKRLMHPPIHLLHFVLHRVCVVLRWPPEWVVALASTFHIKCKQKINQCKGHVPGLVVEAAWHKPAPKSRCSQHLQRGSIVCILNQQHMSSTPAGTWQSAAFGAWPLMIQQHEWIMHPRRGIFMFHQIFRDDTRKRNQV